MSREVAPRIGKLGRPWGRDGELTLDLFELEASDLPEVGWVFLVIDKQMVPFHYDRIRENDKSGALIRFDDLDDLTLLPSLVGHTVHATPELGVELEEEPADTEELIGYAILQKNQELGKVTGSAGTDMNPLLAVAAGGKELLIPFAEGIVVSVDHDARTIHVELPDGLIDL